MYVTVQGDMWDIISKKVYGTEFRADVLMHANPRFVKVVYFSSGVELVVPEITLVQQFSDLPPWKRVRE